VKGAPPLAPRLPSLIEAIEGRRDTGHRVGAIEDRGGDVGRVPGALPGLSVELVTLFD
jgi:hypothetical protein